ncbi:hypothetical protein HY488_00445 [Candidatus Woesearchaeota archaeon]|nr:hypothetical protein [Candidatus Woesearchaeota archaeon]
MTLESITESAAVKTEIHRHQVAGFDETMHRLHKIACVSLHDILTIQELSFIGSTTEYSRHMNPYIPIGIQTRSMAPGHVIKYRAQLGVMGVYTPTLRYFGRETDNRRERPFITLEPLDTEPYQTIADPQLVHADIYPTTGPLFDFSGKFPYRRN